MTKELEFSDLKGMILSKIDVIRECQDEDDKIIFTLSNGDKYKLYHYQDCCEDVRIEDICGDINDLVGVPILQADESSNEDVNPDGVSVPKWQDDSFTWTFYKLGTIKGDVTIRWYGESNGYYGESVYFCKVDE